MGRIRQFPGLDTPRFKEVSGDRIFLDSEKVRIGENTVPDTRRTRRVSWNMILPGLPVFSKNTGPYRGISGPRHVFFHAVERIGNSWIDILMVILVIAIARGRLPTTTTTTTVTATESRKISVILHLIDWQRLAPSDCSMPFGYWTFILWSIDTRQNKHPLTTITWPYRGLKFRGFFEVEYWLIAGFGCNFGLMFCYLVSKAVLLRSPRLTQDYKS